MLFNACREWMVSNDVIRASN